MTVRRDRSKQGHASFSSTVGTTDESMDRGDALPCREEESNKSWMPNACEYGCCCSCVAAPLGPKSRGISLKTKKTKQNHKALDTQMQTLASLNY